MRTTLHGVAHVVVLGALVMVGSRGVEAQDAARDDQHAERTAVEWSVTGDFEPKASDSWADLGNGLWEKREGETVFTYMRDEVAALRALEGIRSERAELTRFGDSLTTPRAIRLRQLDQAERTFSDALAELRGGVTKSVTDSLSGSYCGGAYELETQLVDLAFGLPAALAEARVFYFPFGPIDPLDPTVRYTFTKTWVWDPPTGASSSTSDQDFVTSIGWTSSSSQAQLFSPTDCIANAEAYYVTYNSQACATQIIGASIRLWQGCDTF